MKILVLSIINLLLSLALAAAVYWMSRNARDWGRQRLAFTAECIRRQGRGKCRQPHLYMVNVRFRDAVFGKLITEGEYGKVCENRTGYLEVYIREFPCRLCSPELQKYEFSMAETDWKYYDRKRCGSLFLFAFAAWEALILLMTLQA